MAKHQAWQKNEDGTMTLVYDKDVPDEIHISTIEERLAALEEKVKRIEK